MKKERTFAIHTLGCKLNYSESAHISRKLTENGFSISYDPSYIILNSCAVTGAAEKKGEIWFPNFTGNIRMLKLS